MGCPAVKMILRQPAERTKLFPICREAKAGWGRMVQIMRE